MVNSLDGFRETPNKTRRRNSFNISFPTLPSLTVRPRSVELHQKQYSHDILIMNFSETSSLWFESLTTGVPIKFSWEQGGHSADWYGYVSFVSKQVEKQRVQEMEVHCVGSSFPLKEKATRVFTNCTVPEAARIIAEEHGFHFIGDVDARRFSQLTMSGHSYWEWLQEQAKRIGFALVVEGMNMYFREIDSFVDQQITSVPVLATGNPDSLSGTEWEDRTLDTFKVIKGEYVEDGESRSVKIAGGVDPITMTPNTASKAPDELGNDLRTQVSSVLFKEFRTDQVISNEVTGKRAVNGAAKLARLNMPARAMAQGDPRIKPFSPVLVSGTGAVTDGYWVVKEASHLFQKFGEYTVRLILVTDGMGVNEETSLRKASADRMSTINIQEVLARTGNSTTASGLKDTSLANRSPGILVGNQGFVRTPAVWTASSKGK